MWPGKITTTVERRQAASDSGVPEGSLGGMDGVVIPPRKSTPASMSELQDEVVLLNVPCSRNIKLPAIHLPCLGFICQMNTSLQMLPSGVASIGHKAP